jgi:uncharacterized protein
MGVTKIGRNDPCPCGSGKKYKHCCLKKETAGKSEAMSRDRAWDSMMDKLLDFSRLPRFQRDLESAFDLFWNKTYSIDQVSDLAPPQVMNFLDWYAHDYRTAEDGRRITEILLDEGGVALTEQERELLQANSQALSSAFEVANVDEGKSIGLLDVFQELEVQVNYVPSLQGIGEGQLVLARLAASEDFHRFSWISALVPPELEEDLKTYVQEMFDFYQEEHYQASWAQFLRERSYLFNHFLLKVRGELAPPKILLPYQEKTEDERRPTVLTPGAVEPTERPSILVPGRREGQPPPTVLVPGRDT